MKWYHHLHHHHHRHCYYEYLHRNVRLEDSQRTSRANFNASTRKEALVAVQHHVKNLSPSRSTPNKITKPTRSET